MPFLERCDIFGLNFHNTILADEIRSRQELNQGDLLSKSEKNEQRLRGVVGVEVARR